MKLWLLVRTEEFDYDEVDSAVVRADSEELAREVMATRYTMAHGDEGPEAWTDTKRSTCTELTGEGVPGVVVRSFNAG